MAVVIQVAEETAAAVLMEAEAKALVATTA